MNTLSGTIQESIAGGFIVVININENVPGYLLIQSSNYETVPNLVRQGMELHFESESYYGDWIFASLSEPEGNESLGIAQAEFSAKTHNLIISTGICNQNSSRNNSEFVSYSFGSVRMTLQKFDNESPKPELMFKICSLFSKALQVAPRTSENSEHIITTIFAKPIR